MTIRYRRETTDAELAQSYFRQWDQWHAGKQGVHLEKIRAARQAAEIAEMETGWGTA